MGHKQLTKQVRYLIVENYQIGEVTKNFQKYWITVNHEGVGGNMALQRH